MPVAKTVVGQYGQWQILGPVKRENENYDKIAADAIKEENEARLEEMLQEEELQLALAMAE